MSYLVLARKYRPQSFAEIVGQEHVTRTLQNAFARGRVHHAFLFCGARGVGKTTAARVLAKALCCDKGMGVACGECSACVTITDGSAVDYHEIDGASNNSVDDIRELRDGVRYQPAQLKRKIYVIDEVHMLSGAAFNALLKTLEEPPPHVTFIFATTEVHKIPVTILSRCQRYDFKLVPTSRLASHLAEILAKEKISVDKGALALLAREAGGSVRDALSLTDQVIAYVGDEPIDEARVAEVLGVADRKLLMDLAAAVVGGDVAGALGAVEAAQDRGVDLSQLSRTFLGMLRDLAVVSDVKDASALVDASADEIAQMREIAKRVARVQLLALFERFARACEEMRESPTPRLLMEVALIDMAGSEPLVPVSDLVERLEGLEKRLRAGGGTTPGGGGGARPPAPPVKAAPVTAPAPVAVAAPVAAPPIPSPSPSPSPTTSTSTSTSAAPRDPMAEWEKAVAALEGKHMTLASVYSHARILAWTDKKIELGFAKDSFQGNSGADPDNVAKLKTFLASHLGAPIDVTVKLVQGLPAATASAAAEGGASLAEVEHDRRRAERERRESEARQHPVTKAAIDVLGATIKEIKVDG